MGWLRTFAVAGALTVQAAAVMAADMPDTAPPPDLSPPPPPQQWHAPQLYWPQLGWYLRGDVGYDWGRLDSAQSATGYTNPSDNKLGSAFIGGVGAGVKSRWLRTDLTIDYASPAKYKGTIATADDVTAKIGAESALFNGYLDLGTWYRITPYIGAGAGVAYVSTSDYSSTVAPPFTGDTSHSQWNFAWAAMAGIGYRITPRVTIDVGYRYMDFGDAKTASDSHGAMTFKDVAAHQVRVGLRWSFDDLPVGR
jgi:opacity protein-like surface antigen